MANYVRRTCFLLLTMLFTLAAPLMALAEDIIILHTNDIHCGILDNVGFPHLSQYKKDLKKAGHKVLLVDAGVNSSAVLEGKISWSPMQIETTFKFQRESFFSPQP